jgi:hypothetical protein
MATKTPLENKSVRVQFREQGITLSKTFKLETAADEYIARIESDLGHIQIAQKSKVPIDMAALFHNLHPDLQSRVQLWPVFARVIAAITGNDACWPYRQVRLPIQ